LRIGIAADHAGFALKEQLDKDLRVDGYEVVDYGAYSLACIAANKVAGVRAGPCTDNYSAHQGVEHDDMNIICIGGRVIGYALAWELIRTFLGARFMAEERFTRRLRKIEALEKK
jgi:ribose 5-phosphate isomerase B